MMMWVKSLQYRLDRLMADRRGYGPVVHPRRSRKAVEATGRAWVAWADGTMSTYPRQHGEPLHYDRFSGHHIPESQVGQWMTDELERDPDAMEQLRLAELSRPESATRRALEDKPDEPFKPTRRSKLSEGESS